MSVRDLARVACRARGRCRGRLLSQRRNGPHPPPRRDRNLGHRRTAAPAIRACARCTHLGYLLHRAPVSRVATCVAAHRSPWFGRPHCLPGLSTASSPRCPAPETLTSVAAVPPDHVVTSARIGCRPAVPATRVGRTQITPFGRRTGGHTGNQIAVHIGGSARGYQRNLRNVGDSADLRSDQHVAVQPEVYSSQSCTKMPAMPLTVLG
jgi:hypothetical protein